MTSNNSDNETESSASEPWTDNRPDAEISLEDELSLDNQQQESQDNATTTTEPLAPAPHTVLTSTATTPDLTTTNNEDDEDETPRFNISLDSNDTFSVPPAQSEPISGDTSVPTESSTTASTTFIHSTVTDPQKEQDGSQNAYISYLITTETNVPTFQSHLVKVRRRFSDFFFLYSFLVSEYPACAVPPLPDKNRLEYIKGDRFGPEFTLKRAASLNRFLDRISMHPILRKASTYLIFLESNEWHAYKRSLAIRQQTSPETPSVLDGLSDSLLNAFSKVHTPNEELIDVKAKMDKLDENLLQVERAFLRVLRRKGDISSDFDDFSQQLIRLAGLEKNLESEIVSFANGTEFISRATLQLRDQIDNGYIISLRDLQNYVTSIKSLIKLREQKQLDYEALIDYLAKAQQEKQAMQIGSGSKNFFRARMEDMRGIDHENAKNERLRKLETKIQSLSQEVDNVKTASDTFQDLAINEIAIFENTKAHEMKETLSTLADNHINYYQSLIHEWSALLKT
ncbi:uncharacterized protein SAPINGB_P004487 [Magnusiomyces paraingens]|uniref:Sorting nexin-4 n=1 Tax=Magnusiomyces paraingens TaxID=2606893 RepID=A0A5E8BZU4_9ASCO|nr:uncharacterized protein SAPINGB_P004487 [Saprochaete ingens]VVT55220.1 unnamed protein product [Saprochaete ingens]